MGSMAAPVAPVVVLSDLPCEVSVQLAVACTAVHQQYSNTAAAAAAAVGHC
jgi:hypothetical protein